MKKKQSISLSSIVKEYLNEDITTPSSENLPTTSNKTSVDIANTILTKIRQAITANTRPGWKMGVRKYAIELLTKFKDNTPPLPFNEKSFLNGSTNWREYSEDGNSLIYNEDIAQRVCTPKQLKLSDNGKKEPSRDVTWIDVQGNALYQAFQLIKDYYSKEQI